jgi:hypothetical protein
VGDVTTCCENYLISLARAACGDATVTPPYFLTVHGSAAICWFQPSSLSVSLPSLPCSRRGDVAVPAGGTTPRPCSVAAACAAGRSSDAGRITGTAPVSRARTLTLVATADRDRDRGLLLDERRGDTDAVGATDGADTPAPAKRGTRLCGGTCDTSVSGALTDLAAEDTVPCMCDGSAGAGLATGSSDAAAVKVARGAAVLGGCGIVAVVWNHGAADTPPATPAADADGGMTNLGAAARTAPPSIA